MNSVSNQVKGMKKLHVRKKKSNFHLIDKLKIDFHKHTITMKYISHLFNFSIQNATFMKTSYGVFWLKIPTYE